MNNQNNKKSLYNRTPLRILSFLSLHPAAVFSAQEIAKATKSSKGATHKTLKLLLALEIISRQPKGNTFLYTLNADNYLLEQFKIFETLFKLQPLIKQLRPLCYKISLFGSCSQGSNSQERDIDLFIKTESKNKVSKLIAKYTSNSLNIKAVIQSPLEITQSQKADKVFFEQVRKGVTLWEGKPQDEEF